MIALLRKELRQALPITIVTCLLMVGHVLIFILTSRLDEVAWSSLSPELSPNNGGFIAAILLAISLLVGYSLFPREHDDGTIAFLYSLPVRKRTIFTAKILAGCAILLFAMVLEQLVDWLLQWPNTQSQTGEQFDLRTAAVLCVLKTSFCLMVFCHAVFLSVFRRFGLLIYGIGFWSMLALQNSQPGLRLLDFTVLLELEYHGSTLLVPWNGLILHGLIALFWLLAAALLWLTPSDRISAIYERLLERRLGNVILATASVAIVIVVIGLFVHLFRPDHDDSDDGVIYRGFWTSEYETDHYHFTYFTEQRSRALELIGRAEQTYRLAARSLDAEVEEPIVVDLTEVSREHAGIAGWQKIRMMLNNRQTIDEQQRTLLHETVHVLASQLSAQRLAQHGNDAVFFNEGLAEYLTYHHLPAPDDLQRKQTLAATAWQRQQMTFDELVDHNDFAAKYDPDLAYSLGEVWVAALCEVCGAKTPGKMIRQLARQDAPKGLSRAVLWQTLAQATSCDLTRVNSIWLEQLDRLTETHAEAIEQIPRIIGAPSRRDDDTVVITAVIDPPLFGDSPAFAWVRVRADATVSRAHYYTDLMRLPTEEVDGGSGEPQRVELEIPNRVLSGRRFDYQLGVNAPQLSRPYYEPWKSASVPD